MKRRWRIFVEHYLALPLGVAIALTWANAASVSYFRTADALSFVINDIAMAIVLAYLAQEVVEATLPGGSLHPLRCMLGPMIAGAGAAALLLIAAAIALAFALQRLGIRSSWSYVAVAGPISWFGCYWAGIQPALAALPIVPFLAHSPRDLTRLDLELNEHRSPTHFESTFAMPVQLIVFLFAFVNAGADFRGWGSGTWALITASLTGRPLGAAAGFALAAAAGLRLPRGLGWGDAIVATLTGSASAGLGVLFGAAVFPIGPLAIQAKLGAIATIVGVAPALVVARLLRVGRFAAVQWPARSQTAFKKARGGSR